MSNVKFEFVERIDRY